MFSGADKHGTINNYLKQTGFFGTPSIEAISTPSISSRNTPILFIEGSIGANEDREPGACHCPS